MEENKTKNILITGGAGFIGSHLCKALLELGHNVICLDNLFTGSKNNIADLIDNTNFEFVNHDIVKPYYRNDIDQIYNLACPASPVHYRINPIKTVKTCTIGVINMLGLAKKNNAKILQASTSEVYGDPEIHPQSEEYQGNVNTVGPRSCYDEGKRCSETLFMDYHREHKLKIKIVRIFNTYGPKMSIDDGRVVSNFICQALDNRNVSINGDGSQTRSFQYIDDLVEGLIKVMDSNDKIVKPINLGNPSEITILELARKIISLTSSSSKIIFKKKQEDDPMRRKPVILKAKELINWEPKIPIEIGISKEWSNAARITITSSKSLLVCRHHLTLHLLRPTYQPYL